MISVLITIVLSIANAGDIKVLMIDTGVDTTHVLLKGKVSQINSVQDDHGTAVAGLILYGGLSNRGKPLGSVCPKVKLTSCNFQAQGLLHCLRQAPSYDYVNMSLSGRYYILEEKKLMKSAIKRGTTFVVAAGNNSIRNISKDKVYPASYMYDPEMGIGMHVVGSYMNPQSNWGAGVLDENYNAYSTAHTSSFKYFAGTSVAAPLYLHTLLTQKCKENK
jgi:subtilisin family serine protease